MGNGVFEFESNLKRFYKYVKLVKPDASRPDSSEIYYLARQFKGAKQKEDNNIEL